MPAVGGGGGGVVLEVGIEDTTKLMNIINKILLTLKLELKQKYSASKSQQGGYAIKPPSFDTGECRQTGRDQNLFCGLVGPVLTTSLN